MNRRSELARVRPNKPLELTAASVSRAPVMFDTHRGSLTRGRSLAAIRWAADRSDLSASGDFFWVVASLLGRLEAPR